MGNTKTSTQGTSTATMTPQETAYQNRQLSNQEQLNPSQLLASQNALDMTNNLFSTLNQPNSQMWQSLTSGITDEQTQKMITEQQRYLDPQFQSNGIYDSGMAYTGKLRAATDLANQNAQYNIGVGQNALNLALSGQAQVQGQAQNATNSLASQLAGLRTVSSSQTQTSNPFLSSFYSSLGNSLGSMPSKIGQSASGVWGMYV